MRVIIDPIDGSLNAKRGACHYALSIAVADGETMADVAFAFVHDFGAARGVVGVGGRGRVAQRRAARPELPERRSRDGRLELLGIESADPRWVRAVDRRAASTCAYRLRALGTIAATLCQVAAARFDGMVTLRTLPRRRRRRRAADRPRGRRRRQLPGLATTRSARRWTQPRRRRWSRPARRDAAALEEIAG